jgi:predicted ferric reductase
MVFTVAIFGPLLVYVTSSVLRLLNKSGLSTETKLVEVGNVFGMTAVVTLSWLLIPATKSRGPLAVLFGWDPIRVVQIFHVWSGRIVVVGAIVHSFCYSLRLGMQSPQILWSYYLPPWGCWVNPQTYDPPICELSDKHGCSCYKHFQVFTGLVAAIGLILIGISSIHRFRRSFFSSFAIMHHILTPLTFVMICIHYNRAILYASGSLLYYFASCCPVWIEYLWKRLRHQPVKIVSIEKIDADSSQSHRPCVALTLEASISAIQMYRPGVFGHLSVPSISPVAHPFSINYVPKQPHQIRIIFRVSGNFTRALEKSLCRNLLGSGEVAQQPEVPATAIMLPEVFLQGYCGSGKLMGRMVNHDVSVVVATGIGITPYLSLLSALIRNDAIPGGRAKKVLLHWICRDEALVRYCRKEYMEPSLEFSTRGIGVFVEINIYLTGNGRDTIFENENGYNHVTAYTETNADATNAYGVPFDHSRYYVGGRMCENTGYCLMFSSLSWGGLWIVWNWYNKQEADTYDRRLATLVMLLLYEILVCLFANFCLCLVSKRRVYGWSQISDIDELDKERNIANIGICEEDSPEMASYRDREAAVRPHASLGVLDKGQHGALEILLHDERPNFEQMLEGIHEGQSPALFCCVPPSLAKCLKDRVGNSECSCPPVTVYEETFEI